MALPYTALPADSRILKWPRPLSSRAASSFDISWLSTGPQHPKLRHQPLFIVCSIWRCKVKAIS
ncbi:hypothetical protein GBA52_025698 [Prunus armeniaca]|nr:hypothetical protein GBA52_025698 [Prunus armeniaca]